MIEAGATLHALQQNAELAAQENRMLLAYGLGLTRIELITQSERCITALEAQHLNGLMQRRIKGEPIAYILGQREFFGLELKVTPDVLIPRPETELLVDLALGRLGANACVLDMGTGSGAIAVAIAYTRPDVAVAALDVSAAALAIACSNASRHRTQVEFIQSNWYEALDVDGRRFDLIAANPPYIVAGDPHLAQGDLRFEPLTALTDQADGLSALRTIIEGARQHLNDGGWLLMEHGYDQAAQVAGMLAAQHFAQVQSWRDLAGIERVTGGRWLGADIVEQAASA